MAAYQPVVLVCILCGGRMKTLHLHPAFNKRILKLEMHDKNIKKMLLSICEFMKIGS
jgi:hypothetical protein